MNCEVCGKPEEETAIVFKNEKWCSDNHRKVMTGEIAPTEEEKGTMSFDLLISLEKKMESRF